QWHSDDPVSGKETGRNNAVYLVQQNRNPFVDHPEFVYDLWGYPVGISESHHGITLKIAPNPVQDQCRIVIQASSDMESSPAGWQDPETCGIESFRLIDSFGKQIPVKASYHAGELVLDLSGFSPGLYLVLVTWHTGSGMAKIQKL
ncbi:MAG: endonuclease, partial [Bacteroidales bacterium]|nr:endonuclease [Bacteroidales bacterium]